MDSIMYAVFESGGKQYKVATGDTVNLERMEIPVGGRVEIKNVLMIADSDQVKVGTPTIENAVIVGHIVDHIPGKKIVVFKSKRRKGYRRKIGHRQKYMKVYIDEIKVEAEATAQA